MTRNELRCPHGLPIRLETEKGIVVYAHTATGVLCPLMNSFETTPEDILQEMIQSILDTNEFADFANAGGNRFHEFAIMFKRSADVRMRVYKKIASLSANDAANSKKLFVLALVVLSDTQADERTFKHLVSEFFMCYGLAFDKAITHVDGIESGRIEALRREMEFQKKYVHSMRTADDFDIPAWAAQRKPV
jgi:hypothetical protein